MTRWRRTTGPLAVLMVAMILSLAVSGQGAGQSPVPSAPTDQGSPNLKGGNPKPKDATTAILAAFDKYDVVGISAAHGMKHVDDFILSLIRHPAFPGKVNDIAVECGNSLYQPLLDRYIAGEDVPFTEVRVVWRNTTQPMCSMSAFFQQLFPLVRRINAKLLQGQVVHLFHGQKSAVSGYEKKYPGVTYVIEPHLGFGNGTAMAKYNDQLEARLSSWQVPSLALSMPNT